MVAATAAFGLETAAALYGLPTNRSPDVDAVVRAQRVLPQRRGLRLHVRRLDDADVVELGGLLVTSPAQTYLDLTGRGSHAELVVVGDALLRDGRLTPEALLAGWSGPTGSAAWSGRERVRAFSPPGRCPGPRV